MLLKKCKVCNENFEKPYYCGLPEWERMKFCGRKCYYQSKKDHTPWNKGTKGIMKAWNKGLKGMQVAWNKGLPSPKDEDSPSWKGEKVGYSGLHKWVASNLGKPMKCECCEQVFENPHKIHWANKSREYKRELSDWLRLCASCHIAYDRGNLTL